MSPIINKFLVAIATVIATLATVIDDGLTDQEIIMLIIVGLGALGVYAIPNASRSRP